MRKRAGNCEVNDIKQEQTTYCDASSKPFLPPSQNHSNRDTRWKKQKQQPLRWPHMLHSFSEDEEQDKPDAGDAPEPRSPTDDLCHGVLPSGIGFHRPPPLGCLLSPKITAVSHPFAKSRRKDGAPARIKLMTKLDRSTLRYFNDCKEATTASASARFILYIGMGGRAGCPLGASPVMKNWTAFSRSQPGSPAMLGEVSAHTGIGTIDANSSFLPCSHLPGTNSPFSFIGVWQSPHWPMAFTKYSPCAICCCLAPLLPEAARSEE